MKRAMVLVLWAASASAADINTWTLRGEVQEANLSDSGQVTVGIYPDGAFPFGAPVVVDCDASLGAACLSLVAAECAQLEGVILPAEFGRFTTRAFAVSLVTAKHCDPGAKIFNVWRLRGRVTATRSFQDSESITHYQVDLDYLPTPTGPALALTVECHPVLVGTDCTDLEIGDCVDAEGAINRLTDFPPELMLVSPAVLDDSLCTQPAP